MNKAEQLIRGQQAIDRMKVETSMVVNMLIGVLDFSAQVSFTFPAPNGIVWQVLDRMEGGYIVECFAREDGSKKFAYSTQGIANRQNLGLRGSVLAHETLNTLVEGLFSHFPSMAERLRPILEAAEK